MTFSNVLEISAHYDIAHTGRTEGRHECEVCGRKFTEKHNLRRHLSTVHGVGDVKTFQCDICSRVFKRKDNLKYHLKNVHKV